MDKDVDLRIGEHATAGDGKVGHEASFAAVCHNVAKGCVIDLGLVLGIGKIGCRAILSIGFVACGAVLFVERIEGENGLRTRDLRAGLGMTRAGCIR